MDFAEVFSTSLYEPHFAQPQYTRSSGGDQPPITLIFIVIAVSPSALESWWVW
jgi:hypothetical protein